MRVATRRDGYVPQMAYKRPMSRRRIEGDTLPNALAALARTRERTLAEIDEHLAAKDVDAASEDSTEREALRAKAPEATAPWPLAAEGGDR